MKLFSRIHEQVQLAGAGGHCHRLAIHHHVLDLHPRGVRERKVQRYEDLRPGGALSYFYLFEDYLLPESPLPRGEQFNLRDEILRMDRLSAAQISKITLRVLEVPLQLEPGQLFWPCVRVTNHSERTICSAPPLPVNLSCHWLEKESRRMIIFDGMRTPIFPLLSSGGVSTVSMFLVAPETSGDYLLQLTLVQETVAWFEQIQPSVLEEFPVRVGG